MTDELPWHGLTEAARLTGLDREAIRSRARRGLVPSRKSNRGELLVQVPADLVTGDDPVETEELATLRAAIADLAAEVTDLRTDLARSKAELAAAKTVALAEIAAVKAESAAKERIITYLEQALSDARRPWWRRLLGTR